MFDLSKLEVKEVSTAKAIKIEVSKEGMFTFPANLLKQRQDKKHVYSTFKQTAKVTGIAGWDKAYINATITGIVPTASESKLDSIVLKEGDLIVNLAEGMTSKEGKVCTVKGELYNGDNKVAYVTVSLVQAKTRSTSADTKDVPAFDLSSIL